MQLFTSIRRSLLMRSFLSGALCASFFFMPFYFTLILATTLLFIYERYWLSLLLFFIEDVLFTPPAGGVFGVYFFYTMIGIALLFLASSFHKRLWNEKNYV